MVHGGENGIMFYHLKPDPAQVKPIAIVMNTSNAYKFNTYSSL